MKLYIYFLISFISISSLFGSAKTETTPTTTQKKEPHRGPRTIKDTTLNWLCGTHLRFLEELENIKEGQEFKFRRYGGKDFAILTMRYCQHTI